MTRYLALQNKIQAHLDRTTGLSSQVRNELEKARFVLFKSNDLPDAKADVYAAYANGILFAIENPANR